VAFPVTWAQRHRAARRDALLYSIGGGERGDHACYIEFGWWRFNATAQETLATNFWQPPCADEHHSFQSTALAGMAPPPSGSANGITEIQVCSSGLRLKGVRITKMRPITLGVPQKEVAAKTGGIFDRANCTDRDWRPPSHCPEDKVAVAMSIHHSDDSVVGLELLCATAQAKSTAPPELPLYSLDAAGVHLTAISGFAGTSMRVGAPLEKGYALYSLRSLEKGDQACYIENTSDLFRLPLTDENPWNSHEFRTDSADRCGGPHPGDAVTAAAMPTSDYLVEHQHDQYQTLVRGIRICMNNDNSRLKGIEVRGRSVGANMANKFLLQDTPLDPDKASGARANCHDDGWQRWVDCGAGEVATAAVVHFEAGEPPRAVTGLALECAPVKGP